MSVVCQSVSDDGSARHRLRRIVLTEVPVACGSATDIDAVIQGDGVATPALLAVLRRHEILPRIDDAETFAAANLVLLVRHRPTQVEAGATHSPKAQPTPIVTVGCALR